MGEYLDRFYKNIHNSYCLISEIPGFIFLVTIEWQHPEMLVLGFSDFEISQNTSFSNFVN